MFLFMSSDKIRYVLRIPTSLYETIKIEAKKEHRSINEQIVYILEKKLMSNPLDISKEQPKEKI